LKRLDEGTYGVCEACGREIPVARLDARPEARFCVDDQAQAEREARAS
jgi:DnaK suppressor protein